MFAPNDCLSVRLAEAIDSSKVKRNPILWKQPKKGTQHYRQTGETSKRRTRLRAKEKESFRREPSGRTRT